MGKRVSTGSASAGGRSGKKLKGNQKELADDPKFAHVKKITDWSIGSK